ncbi:MAG: sugar transferase [Pseudomonadales bacterium]|nr:sugar transferase [Pseudomonadales bacterium]
MKTIDDSAVLGLDVGQRFFKRGFDLLFSMLGLIFFSWLIVFSFVLASIDTRSIGFFLQTRVGKSGQLFRVIKIKTMCAVDGHNTTVTACGDPRITKLGAVFRETKIDELPQLMNVFFGDMSFVGPRPDVPGFADNLSGDDLIILSIRPGITGPATLEYKNEEQILAGKQNPEKYNAEVIYPEKVRLNREYIENYSLVTDMKLIYRTVFH